MKREEERDAEREMKRHIDEERGRERDAEREMKRHIDGER